MGKGGDGVRSFFEGNKGRRQGGSMVPGADNKVKSSCCLEVEDDQRKLGR
jgi:hypothetical protein